MPLLTEKQKRFVAEYLIDLNATQAAIRAGYSPKTAYSQGSENLRKPEIINAIQKGQDKLADKHEITKDRIAAELAKIAFSDLRNAAQWNADGVTLLDSQDLDDDTAAAISEVTTGKDGPRIKLYNKQGALMDLAKLYGFVTDRQEISGAIEIGRIEHVIIDAKDRNT